MRTLAIISDTFRALRSRGMFWTLLWISVLLVIVLGGFSCDEKGWRAMYGLMDFPTNQQYMEAGSDWHRSFYLGLLRGFIDWWIMSFALLLAMFSVTGIFPETLKPGTIDFYLSKSVTRLGLFVGKYIGCLCVMLTQVSILAVGGVLVLLLRTGEWHGEMLWSIPLAVLIFSSVLCVNVLLGVVTRSAVASLLWTLLFWGVLWLIQFTEFNTGNPAKLRMAAAAGKGMEEMMESSHNYTRSAMTVLPKTRQMGLLFDKLVHTTAPHSLLATLFARDHFSSDEEFKQTTIGISQVDDGERELVHAPQIVVGSALLFQFAILFLAYSRMKRMDF